MRSSFTNPKPEQSKRFLLSFKVCFACCLSPWCSFCVPFILVDSVANLLSTAMHLQINRIMPHRPRNQHQPRQRRLPEEQMVILWILHGCPGYGTSEDFLQWAWNWFFHQKENGQLGRMSVRAYCEAIHTRHFRNWTNSEEDENGEKMYWPTNPAGAA